jgi:DNA invertase Pin-like site-specific DNA recombinase
MAGLLAVFAEFEREILLCAGLADARPNGKRLGRPPSVIHRGVEVRKLYRQGISKSEIARRLRIGLRPPPPGPKEILTYAALPEGHA